MAHDIICGMYVDENATPFKAEQEGVKYYFCSKNCLEDFLQPQQELSKLMLVSIFSISLGITTAVFESI